MGFLSALGMFILIWKINLEVFCEYQWQTDVAFTVLITWLFFGTFSGVATAMVAGVIFSIFLFVANLMLHEA